MNSRILPLGLCLLLGGCGSQTSETPAAISTAAPASTSAAETPATTLAVLGAPSGLSVNGEAISASLLETYARSRGFDLNDPNQLKLAHEQLVTLAALAQQAVRGGALQRPEVELERLNLLSGVAIADGLSKLPAIDDAFLQQRYQEQLQKIGTTEYRIRHLLFRNGALAEQAVGQLAAGTTFADVMKGFEGNPEVPEARELPWIHLGRIAPQDEALATAIRETPVGQASKSAIITATGWHLIEVLETRPLTPPDFATLKDSIQQSEERSRRDTLVKQIRDAAVVKGLN